MEELNDLFVGLESQRTQQHGRRLLPLSIDVHVQDVVDIGGELDPGTTVRDDPRAEQPTAVGMDLVTEEHARRTMQLRDNDPLGTVDQERSLVGDHRQLTQVDFLLLDIANHHFLVGGAFSFLFDHQTQTHLQGYAERESPFLTFFNAVLGLTRLVTHVLHGQVSAGGLDGKDRLEDGLDALHRPVVGLDTRLQKLVVGVQLHGQEIWHLLVALNAGVVDSSGELIDWGILHWTTSSEDGWLPDSAANFYELHCSGTARNQFLLSEIDQTSGHSRRRVRRDPQKGSRLA